MNRPPQFPALAIALGVAVATLLNACGGEQPDLQNPGAAWPPTPAWHWPRTKARDWSASRT